METTVAEGQQGSSGSSMNWGGLGGHMPFGTGLGTGFGTGFGGLGLGGGHEDGDSEAQKEVGKQATGKHGESNAQGAVADAQKKEEAPPSRAELLADPAKYGMPKGMKPEEYATQYANEYLAKLSYKDPSAKDDKGAAPAYTPGDQNFLKGWGYKFPPTEVKDDKTGLYVAKFEPSAPKSGVAPVIAFRGTEGGSNDKRETVKDVQADLSYSYIGQNQYESKQKEIAALFNDPNGKVNVTGHSLGGALAQKAVADNASKTGALTTFQAPGILQADADKFAAYQAKAGKDGVKVDHHYMATDLVHRAGEAKLGGNFWQHSDPTKQGPDQLGGITMPHSLGDLRKDVGLAKDIGMGIVDSHTRHDLLSNPGLGVQKFTSDPQKDRGMWEGLRKEAGQRINSTHIFDALQDGLNAKEHLGAIKPAWDKGTAAAGNDWNQGVSGGKAGLKEAGGGISDIFHGNFGKGFGEIGHGLGGGIGSFFGGGWNAAKDVVGGAKQAGSELLHGGSDVLKTVGDLKSGFPGMKSLAKEGWGAIKSHGSEIMGSVKDLAVDGIHQLEKGPAGPLIQGVKSTISNGKDAIAHAGALGSDIRAGLGGAASAAGAGLQGALGGGAQAGHGVSEFAHGDFKHGLSDIGHGLSSGAGSLASGAGGAMSSLWSGAKGAAHEAGGMFSSAKKAGGGLIDSAKGVMGLFGHHSK